jgi:hypothetical protein
MLNNNFYANPDTIRFISETQKRLDAFKKDISVDDISKTPEGLSNNAKRAKIKELMSIINRIKDFNKKVEEAKKSSYSSNYRKPPKEYQYKKGQSGNSKGRPVKRPPFTMQEAIYKAFYKEAETIHDGKKVKKSLLEIFAAQVIKDAIQKDGQSRRLLLQNQSFIQHDFMEPLLKEALEAISDKNGSVLDEEKCKDRLQQALLKIIEQGEY